MDANRIVLMPPPIRADLCTQPALHTSTSPHSHIPQVLICPQSQHQVTPAVYQEWQILTHR